MTSIKQQPWKMICQNTNRLITENSKEKITELTEYTDDNGILLMNLTETWLEQKIQHDEIIAGYQVLRCDRRDRVGCGVVIYVKDSYEARLISTANTRSCEMIAVHIEKINVINIVIYRPPGTIMSEFSPILEEVENILVSMKKPNPTVIITGD